MNWSSVSGVLHHHHQLDLLGAKPGERVSNCRFPIHTLLEKVWVWISVTTVSFTARPFVSTNSLAWAHFGARLAGNQVSRHAQLISEYKEWIRHCSVRDQLHRVDHS